MQYRSTVKHTFLNAAAATWAGTAMNVKDYRHCTVKIGTASSGNLTVKAKAAIWSEPANWAAAQSVSNHYDVVEMIDLSDGSSVAGATWFAVSGTDDFKNYAINTDGIDWLNFDVTARSAWTVTVVWSLSTNQ